MFFMKDQFLNSAEIESISEMTNSEIYYQLFDAYKLVKFLSHSHDINADQLKCTLNVLRCLGTIYAAKAFDDEKQE